MTISVLGCGWYGKALAISLVQKGIVIKGSATSTEKLEQLASAGISPFLVQFGADREQFDQAFFDCDILVVSIPPKFRKGETADYLPKIRRMISVILKYQIKKVIYISSTGVYGDRNHEVDELNDPQPDTESGNLLSEAETLFRNETSFKTAIVRFGGLVGPGRHPGRFFAGKTDIPNGMAPVNLIHLQDCIGISTAIIEKDAFGHTFNAVTPDHPQKADFYKEAALKAGLIAPEFIRELKSWKIVNSVNLAGLLDYHFKIQHWADCTFNE